MDLNWIENFNVAITVSDNNGNILYLNQKAANTFKNSGGKELIGKSLFDCHQQRSIDIMKDLLNNKKTNVYTIEKNGIKKLIYQAPWYENDEVKGLIELSLEIPFEMPHFVRT